jgi:trk system potassium uptake protein TrkH
MAESVIDEETVRGIFVFVYLFSSLFTFSTVLTYLDTVRTGLDASTLEAMSVTIATLGNIGPGFGIVGPIKTSTSEFEASLHTF